MTGVGATSLLNSVTLDPEVLEGNVSMAMVAQLGTVEVSINPGVLVPVGD